MQVIVTPVSHSAAVRFENEQHGNRIELQSLSASREGINLVDYTVLVPSDAFVSLRSSDGSLHAEGLHGDVVLEVATGKVEVTDVSNAHLHVKTLSGPVTLTDIRNSHLDVHSVSGTVKLHNVTGSSAEVHSGSGQIMYDGDPGPGGQYLLSSHSGDLEVSIPASASVEIKARSLKSGSDQRISNAEGVPATSQRKLLLKPGFAGVTRFVLRTFRGNIP